MGLIVLSLIYTTSLQAQSQSESLPLGDYLESLEEAFDVQFSYSKNKIDLNRKIDFDDKSTLEESLIHLSNETGIEYKIGPENILLKPSDSFLTFSGQVVDNETGEPLSFCTVGLVEKWIGTVSNSEGKFDFHVKETDPGDSIFISMLGYESFRTSIEGFEKFDGLIRLTRSTRVLDEVLVLDEVPSVNTILEQARLNLKNNYLAGIHSIEGFYRNYFKVDEKYVSLLEAAVLVETVGIRRSLKKDKIFIREIRSNKGLQNTSSIFNESEENFLETLLLNDMIRNAHNRKKSVSILDDRIFDYRLDHVARFDDRIVYVLKGLSKGPVFDLSTTPYINAEINLYVDAETYAIIRAKRTSDFADGDFPWNLGGDGERQYFMVYNEFIQEYKWVDGKMSLSYFTSDFKFEVKHAETGAHIGDEELVRELVINDTYKGRQKDYTWHAALSKDVNLEQTIDDYDRNFWKHYNVIKSSPLRDSILSDLETASPLEKQFEETTTPGSDL